MEGEVSPSTSKKRTEPTKKRSRQKKEIQVSFNEHTDSTTKSTTFSTKENGVLGTSPEGVQNSSPLPKQNTDVVLALACPQQASQKQQKAQRKNKSLTASTNSGTVSKANRKISQTMLCEDQNQDDSTNQAVKDAAKTIDAHEQVCTVVRRKRTAKVRKPLMECGTNIEANTVENNHPNKKLLDLKLDSPGGKVLTTAKTSLVNNRVKNIRSTKKNKYENTPLWKSLEAASETEGEQEVSEVPPKRRKKKSNEAASQTVNEQEVCEAPEKLRKEKSEDAVSQTVDKELCVDRQKRRKKKSKVVAPLTIDEQEVCEAQEKVMTAKSEEAVSQIVDEVCGASQKRSKKKSEEAEYQIVDEQKLCGVQQKSKRKKNGTKAASQIDGEQEACEAQEKREKKIKEVAAKAEDEQEVCEQERGNKNCLETATQIQHEQEVCETQAKKRKKKKNADVENNYLLESMSDITKTKKSELENAVSEISEFGLMRNQEETPLFNSCFAMQSKSLKDSADTLLVEADQKVCEQERGNKNCLETTTQIQLDQEVCGTQEKKRKKKKKKKRHADQENNNLLESISDITKENVVSEISEFGLIRNQEKIPLDNSCLAMQSRSLLDSANPLLVEADHVETYQRKDKDKDSDSRVPKKERSKLKAKPVVMEGIQREKSLESSSKFGCSIDYLQQKNDGDSSEIDKTVQKSKFLVEQTPVASPNDCKQGSKLSLLEMDNLADGSCSQALNKVTELGSQFLKKKKSKKTSKTKLIQSTQEEGDFSKVQKTRRICDVAEHSIRDSPTDYNNNSSFLKANNCVDEIHSPIISATSEQANTSAVRKEDCDISSKDRILVVDNSFAAHPNKKRKHKKVELKHISEVTGADATNPTTLNGSRMEEIVSSTRDDKNDTVMTNDCQIGDIGPSAGSKIDAVMVETQINNTPEIAFVDGSSADLAKKGSTKRKRRRKDKSKNTSLEANTDVGLSTLDTCLEIPDSYAEGNIATSFNEGLKEQIHEKKHKKDKVKHTSQVAVADETNTTSLNGCQMEEVVPSTSEDKNDTLMTKDCKIEEIDPSVGSKIDAVMVGTEVDNLSEKIAFIDDSSVDLVKKKSASRKKRRKAKENTSHEANTLVGLSTLDTPLELADSCAEGTVATFFNADQKEKIPLIGDGKEEVVKHTSQVAVADETNTTSLNGCQMEEMVLSTREDKNDTLMTKDCKIEEIGPSAGSKIDAVMVGTELDNPSEKIAFIDDSSVDLVKKKSASRKKRRKTKENTSHEANTLVGLSTLDTPLELADSCAEGTVATFFNADQKEKIPLIGDGKEEVVLKNECEMNKSPLNVDHENNAVVMGPKKIGNELGEISAAPERKLIVHAGRKLLILDLNGLLVDIVSDLPKGYKADTRISRKALIKRPFCDDFLKFCFEKFNVGVWSSRTKKNVDSVVDYLFSELSHKPLFCWDQSHCTETGFNTIENDKKPLVFKELKKLWEKLGQEKEPDLPWEKGVFNASNTLLLDDSPYKALLNPPHTAIFPRSYMFRHAKDTSLGPGGDIRSYLESVAAAEHVQKFIEQNPFGQHPITTKNPSWKYYLNIIKSNKFCLPT